MSSALEAVRPPTDLEFGRFSELIEREAGIYLSPSKKALLVSRLSARVRALGLPGLAAYYRLVIDGDGSELTFMVDAICTNETRFFRELHHFDLLRTRVIPELVADPERRDHRLRAWSAGCSTGEEPYSLAMLLADLAPAGWTSDILATDLSTKVLARAAEAIYGFERLADIPAAYHRRFLLRGHGGQQGRFKVAAEIRALVRFEQVNLTHELPVAGDLDIILCRNVLIYFRSGTRELVIRRLCTRLRPGGYLLLGHAESLPPAVSGMRTVVPTVYRKVVA